MKRVIGIALIVVGTLGLIGTIAYLVATAVPIDDNTYWISDGGEVCAAVMLLALLGGLSMIPEIRRAPTRHLTTPAEGTLVDQTTTIFGGSKHLQYKLTVRFTTEDGQDITAYDYVFDSDLRKGAPVSLHYNPAKPTQIRIDQPEGKPAVGPGVTYELAPPDYVTSARVVSPDSQDKDEYGIPTRGVILKSSPTGAIVDDCAEMSLRIEVTRPDGTRFLADTVRTVPQRDLPFTIPGSIVDVNYTPGDEQHITPRFGRTRRNPSQ